MSIRTWIFDKLENRYALALVGEHGLRVERRNRPAAYVYCVEPSDSATFDAEDVREALREMPNADFLVVVRRDVSHRAYERAEELGRCLDGFGELQNALENDRDVSSHRSRAQTYLRTRVERSGYVSLDGMRRRGQSAYEISRIGSLRPLTIVTIEHYELTSDDVYAILDEHEHIDVDAIVTTNPFAQGFAREALVAAARASVEVMTLGDFLDRLGEKWE